MLLACRGVVQGEEVVVDQGFALLHLAPGIWDEEEQFVIHLLYKPRGSKSLMPNASIRTKCKETPRSFVLMSHFPVYAPVHVPVHAFITHKPCPCLFVAAQIAHPFISIVNSLLKCQSPSVHQSSSICFTSSPRSTQAQSSVNGQLTCSQPHLLWRLVSAHHTHLLWRLSCLGSPSSSVVPTHSPIQ